MGSQIIELSDKDSEVDGIVRLFAPILYGFICGVGSYSHDLGIAGIALFALIGSLISIFKNLSLFLGMLALGIASIVFPPLGIVAVCVMVFLFFRRLSFLLQHIHLIILGLGCYGLAFVLIYAAPLEAAQQDWRVPVAIWLLGSVAFHLALLMAKKMGYSAKVALEIMSLLPLLLIAFILPFLKLHIGVDHVGPDVSLPDHAMNVMPTAEAHAVGAGAIQNPHFESHPTPAFSHVAHQPVVINGEKPLPVMGNINSPNLDAVQQHSLGSTNWTNGNVMNGQIGGQDIIQNTTGQTVASVQHFGNQDLIKDPMGQTVASVHQLGNQEIIQNSSSQTVSPVQHFGNQDLIKDPLGMSQGMANHIGGQGATDPYTTSTDVTSPANHSTLPNQISTSGETPNIFSGKADPNITMASANNLASSSNSGGLIGAGELSSGATESAGLAAINGLGKVCNQCRATNRSQARYCNGCGVLLPC